MTLNQHKVNEEHQLDISTQAVADNITPILSAQYDQHDHVDLTNTKHTSAPDLDNISIVALDTESGADEISIQSTQGSVYNKQISDSLQAAAYNIANMSDELESSSDSDASNDLIDVQCDICLKSCNKDGNKWFNMFKCTVCEDICSKCHSMKQHMKH